jgi:hypothetical protein
MTSQPGRSRRKAAPPSSRASRPAGADPAPRQPPTNRSAAQPPDVTRSKPATGGVTITPGIVVLTVGAVLILLAFTVLPWFGSDPGLSSLAKGHWHFADVHNVIAQLKSQLKAEGLEGYATFGLADVLFGWRGWLLFAAAVGLGALAVSQLGARHWYLRWLAAVVAFTGAAVSLFGLNLFTLEGNPPKSAKPPSFREYVSHSGLGAWSAMLGFLLIVIAVFLPRRNA